MNSRIVNILIGCLIALFAVVNLVAIPFQDWAGRTGPIFMRPEYFPAAVLAAIAVLGFVLFVNSFIYKSMPTDIKSVSTRVLYTITIAFLYAFLFEKMPFYITTTIATFTLSLFLGERRVLLLIGIPILLTGLLYFGTRYGLKIILP